VNQYSFKDNQPYNGKSFYRLKLMDQNNKISYAPIRTVNINSVSKSIKVYPNPTNAVVMIHAMDEKIKHVKLYDITGKLMINHTVMNVQFHLSIYQKEIIF
jgi:hypothetical protein